MNGNDGSTSGAGVHPTLATTKSLGFVSGNFNPKLLKSISMIAGGFWDKCTG